mgnify:CR=1 FL=1
MSKVLIVEDEEAIADIEKDYLELSGFTVTTCKDGTTGLAEALDGDYDIYILDVMLPGVDGFEICKRIREVKNTPIIMVSAKKEDIDKIRGLGVGADDYIVKPFNMDVLLCRINNLLEAREKLKKLYGKKFSPEALGIEIVSTDDRFTQKFFEIIEKNIANPNLNIDLLSKEIGLSRANLYRKLKAITELSPTELIRNKRLEVAAKLLVESDYTVSEISVLTGFNSHAYFSNSFKLVYGYSPSEFVMKHREGGKIPLNDDLSAE